MAKAKLKYREQIVAFYLCYMFNIENVFRNVCFNIYFNKTYIHTGTSKNEILLIITFNKSIYYLKCSNKRDTEIFVTLYLCTPESQKQYPKHNFNGDIRIHQVEFIIN